MKEVFPYLWVLRMCAWGRLSPLNSSNNSAKSNKVHRYTQSKLTDTTDGHTTDDTTDSHTTDSGKCKAECIVRLKLFRMIEEIANKCNKGRQQEMGNRTSKQGKEQQKWSLWRRKGGTGCKVEGRFTGESISYASLAACVQSLVPSVRGRMERTDS